MIRLFAHGRQVTVMLVLFLAASPLVLVSCQLTPMESRVLLVDHFSDFAEPHAMVSAADGGLIVAGDAGRPEEGWIVKTNPAGRVVWRFARAGVGFFGLAMLRDGGVMACGLVGERGDRPNQLEVLRLSSGGRFAGEFRFRPRGYSEATGLIVKGCLYWADELVLFVGPYDKENQPFALLAYSLSGTPLWRTSFRPTPPVNSYGAESGLWYVRGLGTAVGVINDDAHSEAFTFDQQARILAVRTFVGQTRLIKSTSGRDLLLSRRQNAWDVNLSIVRLNANLQRTDTLASQKIGGVGFWLCNVDVIEKGFALYGIQPGIGTTDIVTRASTELERPARHVIVGGLPAVAECGLGQPLERGNREYVIARPVTRFATIDYAHGNRVVTPGESAVELIRLKLGR